MARSLASATFRLLLLVFGRQGPQLLVEGVDAGFHRRGLPVPDDDDDRDQRTHEHRPGEIEKILHYISLRAPRGPTSAIGAASVPQSDPSAQVSFFQIGTVSFSVSMQK